MKTMDEEYGDGSDHECCPYCGMCRTCGDCECLYGVPGVELPGMWERGDFVGGEN